MIIVPPSLEELKEIWIKILFSRTDKISKVSDGSVNNAVAFSNAKLAQKGLKDVALAQAHFFPDAAYGPILDNIAKMYGISARFGALGSSTYLRVVGVPNTMYQLAVHTFTGSNGIVWQLEADFQIPASGFTYVKVNSTTTGAETAVDPLIINQVNPIPAGHSYIVNEYRATGGRDIEGDDEFRQRIKEGINSLSRPTLSYLKQAMLKFNPNILRLFNYGSNGNGKIKIGIATVNGANLNSGQLDTLTEQISPWLSLNETNLDGISWSGIELVNISWEPIDISFRLELRTGYNADEVRKNIQIRVGKYLDYRNWVVGSNVEWDDLLQIVKLTEGVQYVPDQFFFPSQDLKTNFGKLPRIRAFQMLNMSGSVISDSGNVLNPFFYPTQADFSFISTVLADL